jgi:hypothetical protein
MGNRGIVDNWRGVGRTTLINDRDVIVMLIAAHDIECRIVGIDRSRALYNALVTRNSTVIGDIPPSDESRLDRMFV